jgi:hypothetical protein
MCMSFMALAMLFWQEPRLVGGASVGTVGSCESGEDFWLFVFIMLGVFSVVFQEMSFSRNKWSALKFKFVIGNTTLLAVFLAAVGIALTFESFIQMLPYWVNAGVYVLAFATMVFCGKVADIKWVPLGKALAILGGIGYWSLFGTVVVKQYETQHAIHLLFKPSVSLYRKFITTKDLSEVRDYLRSLDVPIPSEDPIIGIDNTGNCSSWHNPQQYTDVLSPEIRIGEHCSHTREEMTLLYSNFVIERLPHRRSLDNNINHVITFDIVQGGFSNYLNWSFWNKNFGMYCPGGDAMGLYSETLWKIRQRLGPDFTDRMVALSSRLTSSDPLDGINQDANTYFVQKLKLGDSGVDDGTNWPIILEILKHDGFKVDDI